MCFVLHQDAPLFQGRVARGLMLALAVLATLVASTTASGATWALQSTASISATAEAFEGVSCSSERACMAVGSYSPESGGTLALTETWNGSEWSQHAAAQPREATESEFLDVSCTSETACTAVGVATTQEIFRTTTAPLAERWDGRGWTIQTLATPRGAREFSVSGVSCTSASACTAVGSTNEAGGIVPLAETWNGREWSVQTTPILAGQLFDVSCTSSSACTAVGYLVASGLTHSLILRWDGRTWNIQRASSGRAEFTYLLDVSCATATSCVTVGANYGRSTSAVPFTAVWSAGIWTTKEVPTPAETEYSWLAGVSCTSENACMGVGGYRTTPGSAQQTLAEQWNGERWTVVSSPNPRGSRLTVFHSVSCTSSVLCTGTGFSDVTETEALAERYS
jgi:hypothetical protein